MVSLDMGGEGRGGRMDEFICIVAASFFSSPPLLSSPMDTLEYQLIAFAQAHSGSLFTARELEAEFRRIDPGLLTKSNINSLLYKNANVRQYWTHHPVEGSAPKWEARANDEEEAKDATTEEALPPPIRKYFLITTDRIPVRDSKKRNVKYVFIGTEKALQLHKETSWRCPTQFLPLLESQDDDDHNAYVAQWLNTILTFLGPLVQENRVIRCISISDHMPTAEAAQTIRSLLRHTKVLWTDSRLTEIEDVPGMGDLPPCPSDDGTSS